MNFSELYRAYAPDVHRFALFLSGDRALADDLVSETFVRLWHARARVELRTVKPYLLAITRNLFLDQQRRNRRFTSLDPSSADERAGPEDRASARSELRSVLMALQSLPEVDRAAVLLRADENMAYEDIAVVLDITPAAARVKVHRARLKLAAARSRTAAKTETRR
jgi:RNA polymerase sigma-70 factor, ECF subfamily